MQALRRSPRASMASHRTSRRARRAAVPQRDRRHIDGSTWASQCRRPARLHAASPRRPAQRSVRAWPGQSPSTRRSQRGQLEARPPLHGAQWRQTVQGARTSQSVQMGHWPIGSWVEIVIFTLYGRARLQMNCAIQNVVVFTRTRGSCGREFVTINWQQR